MNIKEQYKLIDDTINVAKQSFIMSFRIEVLEHKYNTVDLVMSALSTRLDELRAEEGESNE